MFCFCKSHLQWEQSDSVSYTAVYASCNELYSRLVLLDKKMKNHARFSGSPDNLLKNLCFNELIGKINHFDSKVTYLVQMITSSYRHVFLETNAPRRISALFDVLNMISPT